jgi:hypothetical protein
MAMERTDRLREEAERTLRSWDSETPLSPDPYLAPRVVAMHQQRTPNGWRAYRPFLQVRYAAILTLMVLNLVTILYLELSSRVTPREDLVSVLRDDMQIEPSQDTP